MKINNWVGGMNTLVSPHNIQPSEGIVVENSHINTTSLRSLKGREFNRDLEGNYFKYFKAGDSVISSSRKATFAEYRDVMYMLDGNAPTKTLADGSTYPIGITPPSTILSIESDDEDVNTVLQTVLGDVDIDEVVQALLDDTIEPPKTLTGTYRYVYTYYNKPHNIESVPSRLSNKLEVDNESIKVSDIVLSDDPQTTHIRLYRIGGTLNQYSLVAELDNVSQHYVDSVTDWGIAGSWVLDSFHNYKPLGKLENLTLTYSMLFGSVGDKLYYSMKTKLEYWDKTHFIDFDSEITGIGATQNGILVFTKFSTYVITGNDHTTFSKFLLSDEQGCINHHTIAYVDNTLIWVSTDGVCSSNGGNITLVTKEKLRDFDLVTTNAVVYDNAYYLTTDSSMLVIDFSLGTNIRTINYQGYIERFNDELYIAENNKLYKMFSGEKLRFTFRSGLLTFDGLSVYKNFKNVFIAYSGDIKLKVYLYLSKGRTLILDKQLDKSKRFEELKVNSNLSGYAIQYLVSGIGSVKEIDIEQVSKYAD